MRTSLLQVLLISAFGNLLAVCTSEGEGEGCQNDTECQAGFLCQDGTCICRSDLACGAGRYCNPFGSCQIRPPCLGNHDCEPGFICNSADPNNVSCIPDTQCGSSIHCPFNHYCDPTSKTCEKGCRSTGDCQLGHVCSAGQCVAGGTAADCTICPASPSPDGSYCDYGEVCTLQGQCQPHSLFSKLCDTSCDPEAAIECDPGLICLIDDAVAGGNYCAPVCNVDVECPNGYLGCGGLQLVVEECTGGQPCANGGRCLGGGEQQRGFCECVSQADCDIYEDAGVCSMGICLTDFVTACDSGLDCACMDGKCLGVPFPCVTAADCAIECVQVPFGDETVGTCRTPGKACGKGTGVQCTELKTGAAECRGF